ncbi:KRAB-A domain-containing protein 2-like [Penaeus monodon]|uniref:KRAB-A domain-containing protein 2-like n=1 Tax=Penaeus monodon TaxID=6687 RepID=UPI0018A6F15C|nr:KRAB-A domain-containing protein 2-like [Penaeus monodon]
MLGEPIKLIHASVLLYGSETGRTISGSWSLALMPFVNKSLRRIMGIQLEGPCRLNRYASQSDGKHRFILNYQDHLTKKVCLLALQTKTAAEVAFHLVDIFCDKGAPHILKSDNGREFSNKLVKEVQMMRPECKMVHGKPRHSQSQGSVERANRDLKQCSHVG